MRQSATHPEIILFNANIAAPLVQGTPPRALAVRQGEITALGGDDEIRNLAGSGTQVINLNGRLVTPGFIDTHIHFYEWALKRQGLKLDHLTSLDELLADVSLAAKKAEPGEWIMGQGWNETDWAMPVAPDRDSLDRAAPDHPVLLWRCDLHMAAANSAALALAGIDADTADPPEGRIEKGPDGEPTGMLRELAINLVRDAAPRPTREQIDRAFLQAAGELHRLGVTGICDTRLMADEDGGESFRAFQRLDQKARLDLRTWVTLPGHHLDEIIRLGLCPGLGNQRLRVGHVKFFSDGGVGARTAWMLEPYLDGGCGMPLMDMDELAHDIFRADEAGLSVMVHAIGDRANREIIGIFEALKKRRNKMSSRAPFLPHRLEHVQMIRPEDVKRLRGLGIAMSVNPANMLLDINLIDKSVGKDGKRAYAFRSLMDTGAPVMFSSDCPVCVPDPLVGMQAAVTRQRPDGTPQGGWYPENRVSWRNALAAYTATPAAVLRASDLGAVKPGNKADLAVLSHNVLAEPDSAHFDLKVNMTLLGGNIVHRTF